MLRLIPERIDADSGIGAEQVAAAGKMRTPRDVRGNQHERHDIAVTALRRSRLVDAAAVLEQQPGSGLAFEDPGRATIVKAIDELVDAPAVEEAFLPQSDTERLVLDAERTGIDYDVVEIDHQLDLLLRAIVEMPQEAGVRFVRRRQRAIERHRKNLEMAAVIVLDDGFEILVDEVDDFGDELEAVDHPVHAIVDDV